MGSVKMSGATINRADENHKRHIAEHKGHKYSWGFWSLPPIRFVSFVFYFVFFVVNRIPS